MKGGPLRRAWQLLVEDEDPSEPRFDPVHLAAVLIVCMAAAGCLFWLWWTLLVFEGGIFPKVAAGLKVLFTDKTLADFGFTGQPYSSGVFEGWKGNAGALVLLCLIMAALHRIYVKTSRKRLPLEAETSKTHSAAHPPRKPSDRKP